MLRTRTVARVRPRTGFAAGRRSGAHARTTSSFPASATRRRPRVLRPPAAQSHQAPRRSARCFRASFQRPNHPQKVQKREAARRGADAAGRWSARGSRSAWRRSRDADTREQNAHGCELGRRCGHPLPSPRGPEPGPRGAAACAGSAGAPDVVGGDRSRSSGPHMPSRGGKRRVRVLCPPGHLRRLLPEGPAGARRPGPLVRHLLLPRTRPSGARAAGVRTGASREAAAARPALTARGTGRRVAIEPLKLPEATAGVHCGRAWRPGPAVPEAPQGARARTRRGSRPASAALGVANAEAAAEGASSKREAEKQRVTPQCRFWVRTADG